MHKARKHVLETVPDAKDHVEFDMMAYIERVWLKYGPKSSWGKTFDFVFVDGLRELRLQSVQIALHRGTPIVAYHDSEMIRWYRWDALQVPPGYHVQHYMHTKYQAPWIREKTDRPDQVPNKTTCVLVKTPFDPFMSPEAPTPIIFHSEDQS
jgi:hypothetical protein